MKYKEPRIVNVILRKMNEVGTLIIPESKIYYKVPVAKAVWHWLKIRQMDLWNRIENPERDQQIYSNL